jgi:hypothetical protein
LTADAAAAGKYSLQATSTTDAVTTRQADVSAGDLTGQDLQF